MSTNYITKIKGTDNVTYDINEGVDTRVFRATCSTAANTSAKVATLDDSTNYSLAAGVRVAVTFTYGNSAATPTLNVNSGGAKTIAVATSATAFTTGNGTTYNTWGPYETIIFTYNGTYWVRELGRAIYNAYANNANQNAYRYVKVGSTSIDAGSTTGTIELVAGNNVTLTPDATNKKVTITSGESQRRIIFIGDSYGVGYNSQSSQPTVDTIDNWVDLTASRMGISSSNYFNWSVSGAGFLPTSASLNWDNIIDSNYSSVSSIASTITDVIIGGGINDAYNLYSGAGRSGTPSLITKVSTVFQTLKEMFPNARRWIAPFGWCRGLHSRREIMCNNIFYAYAKGAHSEGGIYISSAEFVLHNYGLMQPDYYHPTVDGENAIADVVSSALMGCPITTCSLTKNGNNQDFLYANMNFTKTNSSFTLGGDADSDLNFLSYQDGNTCFFYSSLTKIAASAIATDGTKYKLGTVSAGHFAGCHYGGTAVTTSRPYFPAFSSFCSVELSSGGVYSSGTIYLWFEEPSNTPTTGGQVDVYFSCVALNPSTSAHAWITSAKTIFDINFKNCQMAAGIC